MGQAPGRRPGDQLAAPGPQTEPGAPRCPAFSLVLWQQLLSSPPCHGLYVSGEVGSGLEQRAKQPCAQAGSAARVAHRVRGVSVPPSSMGSTGPMALVLAPDGP